MNDFNYWTKQGNRPLFSSVDTMQPEQRRFAGKLLIIGGNNGAFFAVANAMQEAFTLGAGEVRALMPSSLRGKVPSTPEVYFAEAENSGAFGKAALGEMLNQTEWADVVLIVGDLGKNAETSVVFSDYIAKVDKPIYVTRDGIDVLVSDIANWGMREAETVIFATMPQLQKMLRVLYYPKVITLSMPTNQLIETLHKFTISYAMTIATFHNDQLVVARDGKVISCEIKDTKWTPITLWSGSLPTKAAVLRMWNQGSGAEQVFSTAMLV